MQQTGDRNIPVLDFLWFSIAIAVAVVVYMLVFAVREFLRRRRDGHRDAT
jgi:hypothetical protein